jgi:hypothetical protein
MIPYQNRTFFFFFLTASGMWVYTQVDIQWVSVVIFNKNTALEKDSRKEMQISKPYKTARSNESIT